MHEELKTGNNDYKNMPLNFARERGLTPASADVIRGAFFCFAKNVTLITVSWMQLL
jgi:hypothetical protein